MSLWTCMCGHCKIWRGVMRLHTALIVSAQEGVDPIKWLEDHVDEVPEDMADLIIDMGDSWPDNVREHMKTISDKILGDRKPILCCTICSHPIVECTCVSRLEGGEGGLGDP